MMYGRISFLVIAISTILFFQSIFCARKNMSQTVAENKKFALAQQVQDMYDRALEQTDMYLKALKTDISSSDKNALITKLINYFEPPARTETKLNSKDLQQLYTSITKNFTEIQSLQNQLNASKNFALTYAERVLGKILLYRKKIPLKQSA